MEFRLDLRKSEEGVVKQLDAMIVRARLMQRQFMVTAEQTGRTGALRQCNHVLENLAAFKTNVREMMQGSPKFDDLRLAVILRLANSLQEELALAEGDNA